MIVMSIEDLMAPLGEGDPSGPELSHDPDFATLERLAKGTPETQFAEAEPPAWPAVHEQAMALAGRTRDLRVAVLLTRAGAHTGGLPGYAQGLQLVAGLLEQQWDTVHPRLDAEDNNDATMRLNALWPLSDLATGMADLRGSLIGPPGSGLTVRLVELAWTKADAAPGEVRPTPTGMLQGLRSAADADPQIIPALRAVSAAVTGIEQTVSRRAGIAGPDFKPLRAIANACAQAVDQLEGLVPASANAATPIGSEAIQAGSAAVGGLQSREDVVRVLGQVCDWVEAHEPSNPAPLLIRRAQRLMSKSFLDLVKELAPQGLSQIEQIAGVSES